MVPEGRLELPCLSTQASETCVSTNSTTRALTTNISMPAASKPSQTDHGPKNETHLPGSKPAEGDKYARPKMNGKQKCLLDNGPIALDRAAATTPPAP